MPELTLTSSAPTDIGRRESSALSSITPMILTFNEAPNIGRTLEKLSWASEIVVIDSFSTDATLEILRSNPRVRVLQRRFDSFAAQCNYGLQQIKTEWVLSLDADYVLSEELAAELKDWIPSSDVNGYTARFTYCVLGRPLRASLYPPRTILYRRRAATYHDEGHGHRVAVDGPGAVLRGAVRHDDRKPLTRWFSEQMRYATRETDHLLSADNASLNRVDRIRKKMVLAPILVFFYTLIGRGLILDGWAGWFYVLQRTIAEMLLSLSLLDAKFRGL